MTQQYYDGKQVSSESESYVTNENGVTVLRRETILVDGTRLTQETPLSSSGTTTPHPGMAVASAPIEDPDLVIAPATATYVTTDVPFAHAITYPETSNYNYNGHDPSGSIAVVTGPPQPPSGSIAVVTGPPQPPCVTVVPQTTNQPLSRHRDATNCCAPVAAVIVCVVCVCCLLPLLIAGIIVFASAENLDVLWDDENFDDDIF